MITNTASWIEDGIKAADAGRSGQALHANLALFSFLFSAVETIIENQVALHSAIVKAEAGQRKP
jgi:hypothetical protein